MRSINKVILIGNLTRDPEVRKTPAGQNVVTFSIATNREWVTKDGRKQSSTEFHDLVAWARLADICEKYLRKSKLVYVEGYLKTRNWTSPDNVRKFRTEIVVQDLIMLDKRNSGQGGEEDFIPSEGEGNKTREIPEEIMEEEPDMESEPAKPEPPKPRLPKREPKAAPRRAPAKEEAAVETGLEPKTVPKSTQPNAMDIDQDLGL